MLNDAARGIVPDQVIDREKGSFPVPADLHLEGPVLELITETLTSPRRASAGCSSQTTWSGCCASPTST